MGYLREAMGIQRRYRRRRHDWREHIEHCRALILRGMAHCGQRRKAVVLGAGLLHDVPLAELSAAFQQVLLVDIVHPFSSRWRGRRFTNVTRVAADITNTIADLYRVADEPDLALPLSRPDLFSGDADVDFTVSINLLSQLPCMPMNYLARFKAHTAEAIDAYARDVMQAHLDYLGRLHGHVVLISDVERLKIDMMRRVVERRDLLFGLKLPRPGEVGEAWEWKLAPCPEADRRHHYFRRVVGIERFKDVS
jgi:hypothetical protein